MMTIASYTPPDRTGANERRRPSRSNILQTFQVLNIPCATARIMCSYGARALVIIRRDRSRGPRCRGTRADVLSGRTCGSRTLFANARVPVSLLPPRVIHEQQQVFDVERSSRNCVAESSDGADRDESTTTPSHRSGTGTENVRFDNTRLPVYIVSGRRGQFGQTRHITSVETHVEQSVVAVDRSSSEAGLENDRRRSRKWRPGAARSSIGRLTGSELS